MCKYQCMKFLHIISGCPQGRGNGTFLMFAMLLYNKKGTASPCFMEKAVPYKKEKHLTKYQVLSSACAIGGGDKRDRTADLLNAIQALSRTIGYAPPDGLGKGLNIPPRQLMRDKLQYSIEGICCQLDIPLRYVPLAVVVARVRAYCAMGSS